MMGGDMPTGPDPMEDAGNDMPMDNEGPEPPMGDGTDTSDQQELDDIFNKASLEAKNAILKYAKSQADNDNGNDNSNNDNNEMPPMPTDNGEADAEASMPTEAKHYKNRLVNEIINSVMGDFDINDRENIKGTKRDEKRITNRKISRNNPFVSRR